MAPDSDIVAGAHSPVSAPYPLFSNLGTLILKDGYRCQGFSFGAARSIVGECVFQTGMVGYTESLTDPSYRGQILILTYPLIGNYGVPSREFIEEIGKLPEHFESSQIHVAGLIVGQYSEAFSHYLANSSLSRWLQENHVPALYGIDTRALTKRLRSGGVLLGQMLFEKAPLLPWADPNLRDLVKEVSTKTVQIYKPSAEVLDIGVRILAVDVGMKFNQIRCFLRRGVHVKRVPYDYDFVEDQDYDGLFLSNGPGDPTQVIATLRNLQRLMEKKTKPIFGICLGHQLLALAAGAKTDKMKFGNRGQNIPATDLVTGRCHITSQNHGYAVLASTLPSDWAEYFVNANDGSNEGIFHKSLPYFSVQFHPEACPGPKDTEYLFQHFIDTVLACKQKEALISLLPPVPGEGEEPPILESFSGEKKIRKVLVLGSGGLSIGQAGEFDYSGSQAIKALKEENIYTILINPNIATIQTSKGLADKIYFLPVTPEFVRKVIINDRPDGILVTFGGQTALNVGVQMKDDFDTLGVKVLGTPLQAIVTTEDRELFAEALHEIGEKCAMSFPATHLEDALEAAHKIGYPVIIRAAYTLGGLGSGFAENDEQLTSLCSAAFASSPQVLVEKSMKGWKEIEYEVVRDAFDNCITVCNMENFDPVGIHTGDSIVVAPSQTLSDADYNRLRTTALKVIRRLGIVGECNIQYAVDPFSDEYSIIEVNARLSRSSALASKATGYPLAFVAAKLSLGIPLHAIKNSVTKTTCACFEPSLDYCVVKIPRWDLKKFHRVSKKISSAMKSVGEVMAIGRTFEEAIQKAIRSVEYSFLGFCNNEYVCQLDEELVNPTDLRLFAIAKALHEGYSVDKICEMTQIDKWFLNKLDNIVRHEKILNRYSMANLPTELLRQAKQMGFSDRQLALIFKSSEMAIRELRIERNILPFVKQIDTVAAEFPAMTNYLYMTYCAVDHDVTFNDNGIMVIGSGVYRIGSSVEFDWCAVHAVRTLRAQGFKTIMVNFNPETVSTDYDEADRLYFETITLERVLDIYEIEGSLGTIVGMGGQTSNNIALSLHRQSVKILGTSPEMVDTAENRYKFSRMLDKLEVDQPRWKELTSVKEAEAFCDQVSYPVLVRPSYVLSGAAMNVVYSPDDLENYLSQAVAVSPETPVVISKFIEEAKEIEMDAIALNGQILYSVVTEHIENAGVHSGDATLVLPAQDLATETIDKIYLATAKIANALNVTGPFNIQFIAKNNVIKVIECNVRASRTFPFVSKVMGVDLIELSVLAMLNLPITVNPTEPFLAPVNSLVAVKVPQFSFSRLRGADPVLGVEMSSTGEVACFGINKYEAYLKALLATGFKLPEKNILISIGSFKEKQEFLPFIVKLKELGYNLFATSGTADYISEHQIPVKYLEIFESEKGSNSKIEYSLEQALARNLIDLYINLPSRNKYRRPASYMSRGYRSRRLAVDMAIPLITNIKCAKLFVEALSRYRHLDLPLGSYDQKTSYTTYVLPGWIVLDSRQRDIKQCISAGIVGIVDPCFILDEEMNNLMEVTQKIITSSKPGCPLVTKATGASLASLLFICSLHGKPIHVMELQADDLDLLIMSKEKGVQVTCDMTVCQLDQHPNLTHALPYIDAFSVMKGKETKALTHLFRVMHKFHLNVDELRDKLYNNPALLFDVHVECSVEIEDRPRPVVYRVHHQKKLVYLDGNLLGSLPDLIVIPHQNLPASSAAATLSTMSISTSVPLRSPRLSKAGAMMPSGNATVPSLSTPLTAAAALGIACTSQFPPSQVQLSSSAPYSIDIFDDPLLDSAMSESRKRRISLVSSGSASAGSSVPPPIPPIALSTSAPSSMYMHYAPSGTGSLGPTTLYPAAPTKNPFYQQHILSVQKITRHELHLLFGVALEMRTMVERNQPLNFLQGRILCTVFYEPSTRTCCSFESAWQRLGGSLLSVNQLTSSIAKGESFADTVRTLAAYSDCIVMRHPEKGVVSTAAKFAKIPVINAGDGVGEHPTQAFLDIYTIREELGTVNGLTVTLVGDLKHGRTVHSLAKLLSHYDVKLNYCSPNSLKMPEVVQEHLRQIGIPQCSSTRIEDFITSTDVLYVTRIQKERFSSEEEYNAVKDSYYVNTELLRSAKQHMIVMHPLPRINEISSDVDFDPRAAYFRQMRYGLFVRMALLALIMGKA